MKKEIFAIFLIILLFAGCINPGDLSNNKSLFSCSDPYDPDLFEDKLIFVDRDYGENDIFLYNLTTKKKSQITFDGGYKKFCKIYGNYIVWWRLENDLGKLYLYDLSTKQTKLLTPEGISDGHPGIYGDKIVFVRGLNSFRRVTIYNISTHTNHIIAYLNMMSMRPDIYKDFVVWTNTNQDRSIYLYDIDANKTTVHLENQFDKRATVAPRIGDGYICFYDDENEKLGYFSIDDEEVKIIDDDFPYYFADDYDISGNDVVWINAAINTNNDHYDLKYCNLKTGKIKDLVVSKEYKGQPTIFGNTIIYFTGSYGDIPVKYIID